MKDVSRNIPRVHLRQSHLGRPRQNIPRFSTGSIGPAWASGCGGVPGWPGTRFEASHFPAVEPRLLPLWSSPQSSPQLAWFSGTPGQASDKFPSPRREFEQKDFAEHIPALSLALLRMAGGSRRGWGCWFAPAFSHEVKRSFASYPKHGLSGVFRYKTLQFLPPWEEMCQTLLMTLSTIRR